MSPMKRTSSRADLSRLRAARVGAGGDDALGVAGVAALAEADHAVVGLRLRVEVVDEARGAPDADRQQAGRRRVQGAGVADTPLTEDPAHLSDGVERRDALPVCRAEGRLPCARPQTRAEGLRPGAATPVTARIRSADERPRAPCADVGKGLPRELGARGTAVAATAERRADVGRVERLAGTHADLDAIGRDTP